MRVLTQPIRSRGRARAVGPVGVCFVIDRLSRAGTETQLLALIRNLDRACVQPSLCLLNGSDPESRALRPRDCPVLDLRLPRLASVRLPLAALRLAAFWRRNRVDVVQTYFLDSTYLAAPVARAVGIRRIVRVRNNTGYWLAGGRRWLERMSGRQAHITLTNSDDARRAILADEELPAARVRVIENGVDLGRFPVARAARQDRSAIRIGAVANLRPVKNIDGLIRAAAVICRDNPRVQFEIAGDGDQRAALEKQIRDAGLGNRVRLVGSVHDVPAFLSALDIAVLCSHSESMSNALLEYMAAGLPSVVTDVGANARLVRNQREGLVVSPGDTTALADAIRRLVDEPVWARELGRSARLRAEQDYSRSAMVRRFEQFYHSV